MKEEEIVKIISEVIPGAINKGQLRWPVGQERPLVVWRSHENINWAIFYIKGAYRPNTVIRGIESCRRNKIKVIPCIIAPSSEEIQAIAEVFRKQKIPIIVKIAGKWTLLRCPRLTQHRITRTPLSPRISLACLRACLKIPDLPEWLKKGIKLMLRSYKLAGRRINDDKEFKILSNFFEYVFKKHGFNSSPIEAAKVLRKLEQSGWGGSRDHFFHSFQNFFLGLWGMSNIKQYFRSSMQHSQLHWNIEPEFVWFLITMWHDVGYGSQNFDRIANEIIGLPSGEVEDRSYLRKYLEGPAVQNAMREIASLMSFLLNGTNNRTSWLAPTFGMRKTSKEIAIENVMRKDLLKSHGTMGSIRLYVMLMEFVNRIRQQERRNVVRQSLLIACVSIPFHDDVFRMCLREGASGVAVPLITMPYAGLLAFIDAIQDDRRSLGQDEDQVAILESLSIDVTGRIVSASIRDHALSDIDFLWKIIEARDFRATFVDSEHSISFQFPNWMVL